MFFTYFTSYTNWPPAFPIHEFKFRLVSHHMPASSTHRPSNVVMPIFPCPPSVSCTHVPPKAALLSGLLVTAACVLFCARWLNPGRGTTEVGVSPRAVLVLIVT